MCLNSRCALQAPAAFVPFRGSQEAGGTGSIKLLAGDHLHPEGDLLSGSDDGHGQLPHPDSPVSTTGDEGLTVGSKGQRDDIVAMRQRRTDRPAGGNVPTPGGVVLATGRRSTAARTEGNGPNRCWMAHVQAEGLARGAMPRPRDWGVATGQGEFEGGAYGDGDDPVLMLQRPLDGRAGPGPKSGNMIGAAREH